MLRRSSLVQGLGEHETSRGQVHQHHHDASTSPGRGRGEDKG